MLTDYLCNNIQFHKHQTTMKNHATKNYSGWLVQTAFILIATTMTTGCANHRSITSENIRQDSTITICHDTVTLIQQVTLRDTVREKAVLTFITDTMGHIIHQREVVHHYESHHHGDSTAYQHTHKDTLRTHSEQRQHSKVKLHHPNGFNQLILILLAGCALLLAFRTKK